MTETENHDVKTDITGVEGSRTAKSMFKNIEILYGKKIKLVNSLSQ